MTNSVTGSHTGTESSLSSWAGPYVTEMLGRGKAIASQPYQAYTGPLTAGASNLQKQAFEGIGSLSAPVTGAFDATAAQNYMNPYIQAAFFVLFSHRYIGKWKCLVLRFISLFC